MKQITIGILSIGSGVGQSIIESIRLSNYPFYTIGLGNNPLAFGAYECDEMIILPSFYDENYIKSLIDICVVKKIQILLPGTDDEALILSHKLELFKQINVKIIVSNPSFMTLIRDKKNLSTMFTQSKTFLACYSLDEVKIMLSQKLINFPLIAKPKNGNASNGIKILLNSQDFIYVTDNDVIQECAMPSKNDPHYSIYINQMQKHINPQIAEYSFQIVLNQDGDEIGRMVSYNKLKNGIPIEIIPYFEKDVWEEIYLIIPELKQLGARGPINIQGRLTDNGLKCFEINARFTGMTGLRAELGFNEVEKCILDYLNIDNTISLSINPNKVGIRQTTNKAIFDKKNNGLVQLRRSINSNKTILLTGANGYLGEHIIKNIQKDNYRIIAQVRDESKKEELCEKYPSITVITLNDLRSLNFNFGQIDTIIHCLFARPHRRTHEIQESLEITQWLLLQVTKYHIPEFINISSFSVYGNNLKSYPNIYCDTLYAQAKYSSELMVNTTSNLNPHLKCVNLRLTTLIGHSSDTPIDLISKWVNKTIYNEYIHIKSNHWINRLDVNDAAIGIIKLMENIQNSDEMNYDFGSLKSYTLLNILEIIKKISIKKKNQIPLIQIENDITDGAVLNVDSSKFYSLIKWTPLCSIETSISNLFDKFQK